MDEKCAVCGKTAYAMERTVVNKKVYHRNCFRCSSCQRILNVGSFAALHGKAYCQNHKPADVLVRSRSASHDDVALTESSSSARSSVRYGTGNRKSGDNTSSSDGHTSDGDLYGTNEWRKQVARPRQVSASQAALLVLHEVPPLPAMWKAPSNPGSDTNSGSAVKLSVMAWETRATHATSGSSTPISGSTSMIPKVQPSSQGSPRTNPPAFPGSSYVMSASRHSQNLRSPRSAEVLAHIPEIDTRMQRGNEPMSASSPRAYEETEPIDANKLSTKLRLDDSTGNSREANFKSISPVGLSKTDSARFSEDSTSLLNSPLFSRGLRSSSPKNSPELISTPIIKVETQVVSSTPPMLDSRTNSTFVDTPSPNIPKRIRERTATSNSIISSGFRSGSSIRISEKEAIVDILNGGASTLRPQGQSVTADFACDNGNTARNEKYEDSPKIRGDDAVLNQGRRSMLSDRRSVLSERRSMLCDNLDINSSKREWPSIMETQAGDLLPTSPRGSTLKKPTRARRVSSVGNMSMFLERQQEQPLLEKTEADALLRLLMSKARELKLIFHHTESTKNGTSSSALRPMSKVMSASMASNLDAYYPSDEHKARYSPGVVSLLFADIGELGRDIVTCVSELIDPSRILNAVTELEKLLPAALEAAAIKSKKSSTSNLPMGKGTFSDASSVLLELGANLNLRLAALTTATQAAVEEFMDIKKKFLIVPVPGFRIESFTQRIHHSLSFSRSNSVLADAFDTNASIRNSVSRNNRLLSGQRGTKQLVVPLEKTIMDYKMEHIDMDASTYRKYFHNQDHRNYIGVDEKLGPISVSVKKEMVKKDNAEITQYRGICRLREGLDMHSTFPESAVKSSSVVRYKPSWRDVIAVINPLLPVSKLKKITDTRIQDDLLKFDERLLVHSYKFGVLYCKENQTNEKEMFGNEYGSPAFDRFLSVLGDKVELKGFTGYSGGLDCSNHQTGTHSVYRRWRQSFEIMYHVSTLLPFSKDDPQQIQRKRHIGNDIISVIFVDGITPYNPKTIKSQFLHVWIVVRPEKNEKNPSEPAYRVGVVANEDVPPFGPSLPDPPVFSNLDLLREFLMAKMINGENAAYKAPKFAKPHQRARQSMLDNIVREYLSRSNLSVNVKREKDKEKKSSQHLETPFDHEPHEIPSAIKKSKGAESIQETSSADLADDDIPYDIHEFLAAHEPPVSTLSQTVLLSPNVGKRHRDDVSGVNKDGPTKGLFQRFLNNRRTSDSVRDITTGSSSVATIQSPNSPFLTSTATSNDDIENALSDGNKSITRRISKTGMGSSVRTLPTPPPTQEVHSVGNGATSANTQSKPPSTPVNSNGSKSKVPPSPPRSIRIAIKPSKRSGKKEG